MAAITYAPGAQLGHRPLPAAVRYIAVGFAAFALLIAGLALGLRLEPKAPAQAPTPAPSQAPSVTSTAPAV